MPLIAALNVDPGIADPNYVDPNAQTEVGLSRGCACHSALPPRGLAETSTAGSLATPAHSAARRIATYVREASPLNPAPCCRPACNAGLPGQHAPHRPEPPGPLPGETVAVSVLSSAPLLCCKPHSMENAATLRIRSVGHNCDHRAVDALGKPAPSVGSAACNLPPPCRLFPFRRVWTPRTAA